ncbi:hypothetical protein [Providencia hangzhouensis]|uniref:hypothetical protein n=1 Tax=Providencia hangzhouensis TaxID=3031799 RepID=UPI0034DD1502
MIIFTTSDLQEEILSMRKGKVTHIITINLDKKFKFILKKIAQIQNSDEFKN